MDLYDDLIDFDYINDFQNKENEFNKFYKQPVDKINFNICYLKNKLIVNTISFEIMIENKGITSEKLLYLIKKYSNNDYIFDFIIIFNFDINNDEIKSFFDKKLPISNYFRIHKNILDININDTICVFKELNTIDIYLKEKSQNFNTTKKIIFNKNTNKTRRKK